MTTKKGLISHARTNKLTPAEQEILHLTTKEFCTIREICYRRKTSKQAVYKILKKLREKGYLTYMNKMVENSEWGYNLDNQKDKRLHAQEFNIKILYKDQTYKKIRERGNIITIDNNTIRLYRNSLEIYSGHCFSGDTAQKATSNSLKYWNKFFARLENEFKIIVLKPRYQNILMVKHEYGNPDSPISQSFDYKPIKLYAKEDGKLWFSMDNSWNLGEHETHHTETAKQDDEIIDKQLSDWRKNDPPTLSEVMLIMKQHAELNKESSAGLLAISKYLESQIPKTLSDPLKQKDITDFPHYIG